MCEFCIQHGEGRSWYLEARNYAFELDDVLKRKKFLQHFYHSIIHDGNKFLSLLENGPVKYLQLPSFLRKRYSEQSKETHFGQVVPLEDLAKILSIVKTITRVPCGCKWEKEKKEARLCFGLSMGPPHWYDELDMDYFGSPDMSKQEELSKEQAWQYILEADKKGFVHSIWTFHTPFIGAICNCDIDYCLAMRTTVRHGIPSMFRAEFVAEVREENCTGCRACVGKCQFRAMQYDDVEKKCRIDLRKCYGCGVCRAACNQNAIGLMERKSRIEVAGLW